MRVNATRSSRTSTIDIYMETVKCPTCDLDAEVYDRYVRESTSGPVEHIKIRCVNKHDYNMTTDWLDNDTYTGITED